ncbi:MAG: enoyl-CoA hydratase/isomerase family protein [Pseudorhodoplanes sp.]|uniref:enoyl-CoA hydratase/isomerase family protein n=1 Tax=Pseudorhodoplanes sp. TaxID=1934341 RepID=UPI003D0CF812
MGRIVVDIADAVAAVTISAPPMNALDSAMRAELAERLLGLERDGSVRAILLRGDGPKAFCAGFDIHEITSSLGSPERTLAQFERDAVLFDRLAHCPKPTLAVVEGVALGGGLELAVCCDFILAGERARFGLPEIKLGAIPAAGGTLRVTRHIGSARARQLILLGDPIDASTALAWGLIACVLPQEHLVQHSFDFARRLAAAPARAMQYAKRAITAAQEVSEQAALSMAREDAARLSASTDLAEGVRSFLERRSPVFSDSIDDEH